MKKLKIITLEKLIELRENSEKFKLVETLSPESYKQGHIPGAINFPTKIGESVGEIKKVAASKGLKKSDVIVTYCASYTCRGSTNAARLLLKAGFKNVLDFKASKKGWTDAGFELEQWYLV